MARRRPYLRPRGHRSADRCYAWSSRVEGSDQRRLFAVLHTPPVASPADAVRAALLQEPSPDRNGDQISRLPDLDRSLTATGCRVLPSLKSEVERANHTGASRRTRRLSAVGGKHSAVTEPQIQLRRVLTSTSRRRSRPRQPVRSKSVRCCSARTSRRSMSTLRH